MSRIGNQPIKLENNVTLEVSNGGDYGYKVVKVTGPKGELVQSLRAGIEVEIKDGEILVIRLNEEKQTKALHGLYRSLVANMVHGVSQGFKKELHIEGI